MLDRLSLGIVPAEEACAQVGDPDYRAQAMAAGRRYIDLLRATVGPEPDRARLRIAGEAHAFGTYYEVVCEFDSTVPAAVAYAWRCAAEAPTTWPRAGLTFPDITTLLHPLLTELQANKAQTWPESEEWYHCEAHLSGVLWAKATLAKQADTQAAGEPDGIARWTAEQITHILQHLISQARAYRDQHPPSTRTYRYADQREVAIARAYTILVTAASQKTEPR